MLDPSIPPIRPGRRPGAASVARLGDAAARVRRSSAAAPLLRIDGPAGDQARLAGDPSFPARLSGSGNPYSFVEVHGGPGGNWLDLPGGRTGAAYEMNGKSGLSGMVVEVTPVSSGAGQWHRFLWRAKHAASGGSSYPPPPACLASSGSCPNPGYYLLLSGTDGVTVRLTCGRFQQYDYTGDHLRGDEWSGTASGPYTLYATDGSGNTVFAIYQNVEASVYFSGGIWNLATFYYDLAPGSPGGGFGGQPGYQLGGTAVCGTSMTPFSVTYQAYQGNNTYLTYVAVPTT